jgi:hypothetical protein
MSITRKSLLILPFLVVVGYCGIHLYHRTFIATDGQRYISVADDALISFRYGWNLAHGNGLVWNPGERVEGITNTLWTLLSGLFALGMSKRLVPFAMLVVGMVFFLLASWGFQRLYDQLSRDGPLPSVQPWSRAAAFLLPASWFPLFFWSLRGMEISLLVCLLTWSVVAFVRDEDSPSWKGSLLLGLALLTRPDTIIPAAIIFAYRFFLVLRGKLTLRIFFMEAFLFGVFLIGSMGFRFFYYGEWAPNTYALKATGLTLLERVQLNGFGYIRPYLLFTWPLYILVALSLVFRPTAKKILLILFPLAMIAYTIYIGGDGLGYWRYPAPTMPFLFLVLLSDVPFLLNRLPRRSMLRGVGLACGLAVLLSVGRLPYERYLEWGPQGDDVANINMSLYLEKVLRPGATVGSLYAGGIPYYTGFHAIDFLGKCDPHIARLPPDKTGPFMLWGQVSPPGHNKYDLRYSILEKKPTFVSHLQYGRQDLREEALGVYFSIPVSFPKASFVNRGILHLQKDSPQVRWDRVVREYKKTNG